MVEHLVSVDCEIEIPMEYYSSNNFNTLLTYIKDKLQESNTHCVVIDSSVQHRIRKQRPGYYTLAVWGAGTLNS